jgi:UDP-2,3-diacylglucosamine pyrophosphatase LpxH
MNEPTRLLIVGDLHLAAGPHDPFHRDQAFAGFLASQLRRGVPPRLIIVGDLFDFVLTIPSGRRPTARPDATEAGALARLDSIAAAHPTVIDALAAFADGGGMIDLVPGNHDIELVRPAVQRRLRALLGEPAPGRLRVHPWIVHLPGVLYAEHGHQHHDLNAFATLLEPYLNGEALDLPLGSHLTHLQAHAPAGALARRAMLAGTLARRAVSPGERARLRRYRAHGLAQEVERTGLDRATLAALDAVTPRTPAALVARLARRSVGAGRSPGATTHRAADRIHGLLAAQVRQVAFYVFGHSHVSERRVMVPGQETPLYLNPGTWSALRRGADARQCPYVEIAFGAERPVAELLNWEGDEAPRLSQRVTADGRLPALPAGGRSGTVPSPR